ncbi:MAG TPA: BON domain-containing protein [Thermoanaerobaculia bacterium]|nr:BON domain-containing protein [Thermoanaerobaculia bacterium]
MRKVSLGILGVVGFAALFTVACGQTDMGITTKVKSRLGTDRALNSSQIQVSTKNKVVTLSGPVDSVASKEKAVGVARGVEGVADVVDNLSVSAAVAAMPSSASGTNAAPDDSAITQAVKRNLQAQPETASEPITVQTEGGVVTLTGTVKTPAEKDQVVQIARGTEGVQRVEDRIQVGTS